MSAWSSTTRMRLASGLSGTTAACGSPASASGSHHSASVTDSARNGPGSSTAVPGVRGGTWWRPSGTATVTVDPGLPQRWSPHSMVTEPPSNPTSSATSAGPTPPSSGGAAAVPVVATRRTAEPPSRPRVTVIRPPAATARASRATTTCSHIDRSTKAGSPRSGQSSSRVSPAWSAADRNIPARPAVSAARSTGSKCGSTCPAYSRESSSSRSTIRRRRCALRCTSSRSVRRPEPGGAASRSSATGPSTSVSGVRNSSLIRAKNAVLARSSSVRCSARRCWAAKASAAVAAVDR